MRKKQQAIKVIPKTIVLRIAIVLILVSALLPVGKVLASELFQIGPYEVDVTIDANPSPSYIEQTVEFTVTVTLQDSSGGTASGRVELRSGDEKVCDLVLDSGGQASCQLYFDTPAVIPFQAFYLGVDQILPGASPRILHTVMDKHHPLVSVIQDDPDPSIINRDIFANVRVTSEGPIPSGPLVIYRSDETCLTPDANMATDFCVTALNGGGIGSCTLPLTQEGFVSICSAYAGDYAHYPALSAAEPHRVSDSNTFTTITSISPDFINGSFTKCRYL